MFRVLINYPTYIPSENDLYNPEKWKIHSGFYLILFFFKAINYSWVQNKILYSRYASQIIYFILCDKSWH